MVHNLKAFNFEKLFSLYKSHVNSKTHKTRKMVAYVDKNFSLACFLVLLLFVDSSYARFNTLVTKDQIHTICTKQEINSSFCFQVLNTNPEIAKLDFPSLFKFVLNYQAQNISDTLKQFKLSGGYMPDVESQYSLCIELYGYAFDNRDITLRYLAAKDYNSVNTRVSGTLEDIFTCTDDLSTMKPIPQFFMTESNLIKELSKILLVILECFISKRKEFCN